MPHKPGHTIAKGNPQNKKPKPINPFKKAADILKKGTKKKKQ